MNLLEYEAKEILKQYGLPTPNGVTVHDKGNLPGAPVVLKSQVPTGGRGKLGGIRIIKNQSDIASEVASLRSHEIKGFMPQVLLAEELLTIEKEFYISILINRSKAAIQIVAHPQGGVEVEENDHESFLTIDLTTTSSTVAGEQLAELYNLPEQTFVLQDLVKNLHECFIKNDATLIEINPLVLTSDSKIIAGDCKMTLDDSARFRHPEWQFASTPVEANFVTLDKQGTVATIANGAGLAMATVDAVVGAGMAPANFLDIGGGASASSVLTAFCRIATYPNVKAIVINIFAGITRCDEVARAIIEARAHLDDLPPLCIRLAGTNYHEAAKLLADTDIVLLPTLEACIEAARKEIAHG